MGQQEHSTLTVLHGGCTIASVTLADGVMANPSQTGKLVTFSVTSSDQKGDGYVVNTGSGLHGYLDVTGLKKTECGNG